LRQPVVNRLDSSDAVPADIFLWQVQPTKPWLTKLGGTPYWPQGKPWPTNPSTDTPFTFIAQFCFLDSLDLLPPDLPGDLLTVFFKNAEAPFDSQSSIRFEWLRIAECKPSPQDDCPRPSFKVPELFGVRYRGSEYPQAVDEFEKIDCGQSYLLAVSQSTKIGTEAWWIQGMPDVPEECHLIATLNSLELVSMKEPRRWPLIDLEVLPPTQKSKHDGHYGWNAYEMMLGDVGCIYILHGKSGVTYWRFDCY
jgi:hypothetical protein